MIERLGIHRRIYAALLRAYLLMDLRSQHYSRATATKPGSAITPMFWVICQYLFISAIVSAVLFARVDVYFYALVGLTVSILLIASAMLVEFNEVVLDPGDMMILGHRPIPPRTYAAARLSNLLVYILVLTFTLNIFPAIVGAGLADAGPLYLPAYLLAAFCANLCVCGIIILVHSTAMVQGGDNPMRDLLAWTQIILAMVVFYGAQLMLRDASKGIELFADAPPAWVEHLPPAWLAQWITGVATAPQPSQLAGAGIMVGATLLLAVAAVLRLSRAYSRAQGGAAVWRRVTLPRPRGGRLAGPLLRLIARSREEATALWMCLTMFRRDPDVKMRNAPALGMVVASVVLGAFGGHLGNPFVPGSEIALSMVSVYLLVSTIPVMVHNFAFSRDHEAAWLLRSAPLKRLDHFAGGVRKAVMMLLVLPFLLGMFVTFAIVWKNPAHAAAHCAIGWLTALCVSHLSMMTVGRRFPGSRPLARGESIGPIGIPLAGVSCLLAGLGAAHYFALRSLPILAGYAGALLLASLALKIVSDRSLARNFG